jgi:hypothetical protein
MYPMIHPTNLQSISSYCREVVSRLLGVNASRLSGLSGFGLDEKVDEEKAGKESSQSDGKVGTELDLKGDSVGGESLDDRVKSKGRGSEGGNGQGTDGGLTKGNNGCTDRRKKELA